MQKQLEEEKWARKLLEKQLEMSKRFSDVGGALLSRSAAFCATPPPAPASPSPASAHAPAAASSAPATSTAGSSSEELAATGPRSQSQQAAESDVQALRTEVCPRVEMAVLSLCVILLKSVSFVFGSQLDEKDRVVSEQKRELIELRHRLEQTKRLYEASKLLLEHQATSPPPQAAAASPTLAHRSVSATAASSTSQAALAADEYERLRTQLNQVSGRLRATGRSSLEPLLTYSVQLK